MKKLLLIAAASATILSSSAFADCTMTNKADNNAMMMNSSEEGQFYVKALVGGTIFDTIKPTAAATGEKIKIKSKKTSFIYELGAGYYVTDIFRADVTFAMPVAVQFKKTVANGLDGVSEDARLKIKPTLASLLVNGYVDVFDAGMAKFFIGAGIGASYVKEKVTASTEAGSGSISSKKKYNFAWQGSVGASTKVADGVNAELVYSYRDYGKAKNGTGVRYKGNNVMVGVRFDI